MFLGVASGTGHGCRQHSREHVHSSYLGLELKQRLLLTLQPPTPQPQAVPLVPAQRVNMHSER